MIHPEGNMNVHISWQSSHSCPDRNHELYIKMGITSPVPVTVWNWSQMHRYIYKKSRQWTQRRCLFTPIRSFYLPGLPPAYAAHWIHMADFVHLPVSSVLAHRLYIERYHAFLKGCFRFGSRKGLQIWNLHWSNIDNMVEIDPVLSTVLQTSFLWWWSMGKIQFWLFFGLWIALLTG